MYIVLERSGEDMLNRLKKKQNKKGFTLVEIIVVLVILAILAAIAVPAVLGYVEDAKKAQYISEARSIFTVVKTEEAKANIGPYTQSNFPQYESLHNRLMDYIPKGSAHTNLKGEGIAAKKTGLPSVKQIYLMSNGKEYLYYFTWISNNGHEIVASVFQNKKVTIEMIDGKAV